MGAPLFSSPPAKGWKPIKTLTLSADSSVDFVHGANGVILNNLYKNYAFVFDLLTSVDGNSLHVLFSTNGGTSYGTSYDISYDGKDTSGGGAGYGQNAFSNGRLITDIGNAAAESVCGCLYLMEPSNTAKYTKARGWTASDRSAGNGLFSQCFIRQPVAQDVDAVRWGVSSGHMTGTIQLFAIEGA